MEECYTTLLPKDKNNQQIQPKLSTIFKHKVVGTPQAFGTFMTPMEKDTAQFRYYQSI